MSYSKKSFQFHNETSAQLTIDMKMIFYSGANKTHFHMNGCATIASIWKWDFLELASGLLNWVELFNMLAITVETAEKDFAWFHNFFYV